MEVQQLAIRCLELQPTGMQMQVASVQWIASQLPLQHPRQPLHQAAGH